MIKTITAFFDKAFRDEKTRIIVVGISFALYIIWSEWRAEVRANDSFVMSELHECRRLYQDCTIQVIALSDMFARRIDSINKQNLEIKAELIHMKMILE